MNLVCWPVGSGRQCKWRSQRFSVTVAGFQMLSSLKPYAQQRRSAAWIPGSTAIHQLWIAKLPCSTMCVWCLDWVEESGFATPAAYKVVWIKIWLGVHFNSSEHVVTLQFFALQGRCNRPFAVCPRDAACSFAASDRLWLRGGFLTRFGWLRCSWLIDWIDGAPYDQAKVNRSLPIKHNQA